MGNANPIMEILKRYIRTLRRKRFRAKASKQRNNNTINSTDTPSGTICAIRRSNLYPRRKQTNKKHKPSEIIHHIKFASRLNKQSITKHLSKSISINLGNY